MKEPGLDGIEESHARELSWLMRLARTTRWLP